MIILLINQMCAFQQKYTYQCSKYIFVFKTFNDILYIKLIKNDFLQHHSKYNNSYSPRKQIIPHNTSNLHEIAPLLLLTCQKTFCLGRSLSNYVVLVVKSTFTYLKKNIVDNHIRKYIQNFITIRPS
jgi:hypothetical protein